MRSGRTGRNLFSIQFYMMHQCTERKWWWKEFDAFWPEEAFFFFLSAFPGRFCLGFFRGIPALHCGLPLKHKRLTVRQLVAHFMSRWGKINTWTNNSVMTTSWNMRNYLLEAVIWVGLTSHHANRRRGRYATVPATGHQGDGDVFHITLQKVAVCF